MIQGCAYEDHLPALVLPGFCITNYFFKADDNAKLTASFSERCLIGTISCYSGLVHCAAGFDSAVESRKKCGESYRWAKKSQTGQNHRHFVTVSSKWFSNANTVSNIALFLWVINFLNLHSFIFVKKWNMVQKVFVNSYHDLFTVNSNQNIAISEQWRRQWGLSYFRNVRPKLVWIYSGCFKVGNLVL